MRNSRPKKLLKLSMNSTNRYYHSGIAINVHKAIRRGLIKSRGIAFRGKLNPKPNDPREIYKTKHSLPDFNNKPRRISIDRSHDEFSFRSGGKELSWRAQRRNGRNFDRERQEKLRIDYVGKQAGRWATEQLMTKSLRKTMKNDMDREKDFEGFESRNSDYRSPSSSRQYEFSGRKKNGQRLFTPSNSRYNYDSFYQNETEDNQNECKAPLNRRARRAIQFEKTIVPEIDNDNPLGMLRNKFSLDNARDHDRLMSKEGQISGSQRTFDSKGFIKHTPKKESEEISAILPKRFPISVPYTTAASEFLYGTSVIESILTAKESRRKLYKLFIYSGDNREDIDRDEHLQRLAEDKGITVKRVGNDWIRTLDKMSHGRPHNGYVLEASPLPRLPVQSLGEFLRREDAKGNKQVGFEVQIDHQSHEEAAINGTMNFIQIQEALPGKKPLVLLLDHILDPGNLGGIIRTASFFGISAIAVSTRNCAPMTPIVSKASAGASESAVMISVQNPADFITESKKAGWFVYAAVAPPLTSDSHTTDKILSLSEEVSTDLIPDKPSIIMMGSEGDGLRRTLRNKADLQVYVPGCVESTINSLNVTVASGIMCHILSRRYTKSQSSYLSNKTEKHLNPQIGEQQDNLKTVDHNHLFF